MHPDRHVLIVEDDADLREALAETLEAEGMRVCAARDGAEALQLADAETFGLVISDMQMQPMGGAELLQRLRQQHPELPVVLMTAYGTIPQAVEAMRAGASDFLVKPFEAATLVALARRHLTCVVAREGVIAVDPASRAVFELVPRLAASDATVLITGESGTGKEVIARALHAQSARAAGPFIAINCAAIPEQMLEATLFGHERGAFTGAVGSHAGKFEQAQGGTLLLDEVSELPLALQAKLLRVLQEREVERVGGRRAIPLDVRVLATSNRRLREEVTAGRFREDLYFRLNVLPLHMPPLRERGGDILPLAEALLARHGRAGRPLPALGAEARARLLAYPWPGNVREMDNVIQRALVLSAGDCIEPWALQLEDAAASVTAAALHAPVASDTPESEALQSAQRRHEAELIAQALRSGTRRAAAARLGISERTLRYKLARLRASGVDLPLVGTACA
jgi:two-component system response regulator FlrC